MKKTLLSLLGILLFPVMANAAEPLHVRYGIYASGFNVATIDTTYTLTQDSYKVDADLKTAGLLGALAPWSGVVETAGINKNGTLVPQNHEFISTWRSDTNTSKFTFDKAGTLIAYTKSENDKQPENNMPPEEVYADNPVDMLTGLFSTMMGNSCASSQHAMDGKRRFDMVFRSKGTDVLEENQYNSYTGDAEICEVEIVPVAGKWREKPRGWMNIQSQAKAQGQLPRLWFAKIREDMPPIPVRMLIKTDYGTMLMHLQDNPD